MYTVRLAHPNDIPTLRSLIERSARGLSVGYYEPDELDAAVTHVFGVDSALVADQTYFVVEYEQEPIACGGWSRRRTLYGGDQRPMGAPDWLDPARDAARIRAFFVAPEHARKGVGRMLLETCVRAAEAAGFTRLELMATLPGVPFYEAEGFAKEEAVSDTVPNGVAVRFVRMTRATAKQ